MSDILLKPDQTEALASIDSEATAEQILAVLDQVAIAQRQAREFKRLAEEAVIEWIDKHGELTVGDIRYYVGTTKTVKAVDNANIGDALLEVTGGDVDRLNECLTSNPWKHGQVRKVLEQFGAESMFDDLFTTETRKDLKTGKPTRSLKRADERFLQSTHTPSQENPQ